MTRPLFVAHPRWPALRRRFSALTDALRRGLGPWVESLGHLAA